MPRHESLFALVLAGALLAASCGFTARRAFDKGTKLYERGLYAEASIEFRRAIQKDPKFGEAYLKLGLTELKQNNPPAAADALKHALALLPGRVEPKTELAQLYLSAYLADPKKPAGLYRQAAQYTSEILGKDPNSFDALRLEGYLAVADNKPKEAITYFQRAHQVRSDEPDVVSMLVENLFRDGQSAPGESLASHFMAAHPDYGPLYDLLYAHFVELKRPEEAEKVLRLKMAKNPRNSFFVTQLCRHYWNVGKREQAVALLTTVVDHPRDFPAGHFDAANFFAENGDWTAAAREYEAGIAMNPPNRLTYQKRLATVLLAAGKRTQAEKVLDGILKDHPEDDDARASRTSLRVASGNPQELDQAAADLKTLVQKQPGNVKYAYQLGQVYELKGQEEAAKAQYLGVLRLNNSDAATLDSLSHLYLAEQRFADAKRYADMWLAIDPKNPGARLVQSASLEGLGDYPQTRVVLASLIRDFPDLEGAYLQLGLLDVQEKRYDDAEALFRKHYQPGRGDTRLLKGMVEMYAARAQWDKAIAVVQREADAFPQSPELRRLLATTCGRAGSYDLAIEQFRKLQQMQPAPDIPLQLGLLYDAKGQFDQALTEFQTARQMNAKDPLPPAMLGKVFEQTLRWPEAVANYRESIRLDPGNASVLNNLAFALSENNGDLGEALQMARRAIDKNPGNLEFNDTLGWVYLKKKDIPSALQVFRNIRQKEPGNATFRIHLAMAYKESGDRGAARQELTAAGQLHPSTQEGLQIKQLLERIENP